METMDNSVGLGRMTTVKWSQRILHPKMMVIDKLLTIRGWSSGAWDLQRAEHGNFHGHKLKPCGLPFFIFSEQEVSRFPMTLQYGDIQKWRTTQMILVLLFKF